MRESYPEMIKRHREEVNAHLTSLLAGLTAVFFKPAWGGNARLGGNLTIERAWLDDDGVIWVRATQGAERRLERDAANAIREGRGAQMVERVRREEGRRAPN